MVTQLVTAVPSGAQVCGSGQEQESAKNGLPGALLARKIPSAQSWQATLGWL